MESSHCQLFWKFFSQSKYVVDNILYIPNFTSNFLTVAKLVDNLSYVIIFYCNGFHIPDKISLKIIGSVEMQDRIYILRVPSYKKFQIKPIKSSFIANTVNFTIGDLQTF